MNDQVSRMDAHRSDRSNVAHEVIGAISHVPERGLQIPMTSPSGPRLNRLLASLPPQEWRRWSAQLELVEMPLGKELARAGGDRKFVYFPTTSIVSLQHIMSDGSASEIAVVSAEGVVGVSTFLSGGSALIRAVVRCEGHGYRINAEDLMEEFERSATVKRLLLLFTQALITQMAQTVICNRYHSIEQHLCRWLLGTLDRTHGCELQVTHEFIANSLGVRREGITLASVRLQNAGLIRHARGHISIRDRKGLKDRVCECYSVVTKEYSRLLRDWPSM